MVSGACLCAVVMTIAPVSGRADEETANQAPPRLRSWQVSLGVGTLFPTEVSAHLRTHTDPSLSFQADATLPGPLFEYGVYARQTTLRSSETGGIASLWTFGLLAKYELRPGRRHLLRAGLLVGLHDLVADTIDNAIGLDLGASLEWAMQVASRVRLRCSVLETSMLVGGIPDRLMVRLRPTAAAILGVEYAFRP